MNWLLQNDFLSEQAGQVTCRLSELRIECVYTEIVCAALASQEVAGLPC